MMDPMVLFDRAARRAVTTAAMVRPEQLHAPTPCRG